MSGEHTVPDPSDRPRIGSMPYPDREWEVWDQDQRYRHPQRKPDWNIWHPALVHNLINTHNGYASLADAFDQIAIFESLHADALWKYRWDKTAGLR